MDVYTKKASAYIVNPVFCIHLGNNHSVPYNYTLMPSSIHVALCSSEKQFNRLSFSLWLINVVYTCMSVTTVINCRAAFFILSIKIILIAATFNYTHAFLSTFTLTFWKVYLFIFNSNLSGNMWILLTYKLEKWDPKVLHAIPYGHLNVR